MNATTTRRPWRPSCGECDSIGQHLETCSRVLTIWCVYFNPSDYEGKFVLRAQYVVKNAGPSVVEVAPEPTAVCDSLFEVRSYLPPGLYGQGRAAEDDPTIVETWF